MDTYPIFQSRETTTSLLPWCKSRGGIELVVSREKKKTFLSVSVIQASHIIIVIYPFPNQSGCNRQTRQGSTPCAKCYLPWFTATKSYIARLEDRQTDRRMDGRTDRQTDNPCYGLLKEKGGWFMLQKNQSKSSNGSRKLHA